MADSTPVYLALGDSMSIDDYTGVEGGGAAKQFFRTLGKNWTLDDRTCDGYRMPDVPTDGRGHIVTLTIGGNDLLWNKADYLTHGLGAFAEEHLRLLQTIRAANPDAVFVVGDVYHPDARLSDVEYEALLEANRIIHANCHRVNARIAPIFDTFRGHEREFLCLQIEPTRRGAEAIAGLFRQAVETDLLLRRK